MTDHDPPLELTAHVCTEDRAGRWRDGKMNRKIYLAGSWKNAEAILRLRDLLASNGHEVDCFASTDTGRTSFNWSELTLTLGCQTREDAELKLKEMDAIDLLSFDRVREAFQEDKKYLDWCDTCILILPSGKSAHLEAGYAKGQGKTLIIFGDFQKGERDVMYGFANALFRETEVFSMMDYLQHWQPFSCAGKRAGKEDPRFLWDEMFRIVKETKPYWIVGENVTGIISMALDEIGSNLENFGYSWRAFSLSALHADLNFDGERVFIVATTNSRGIAGRESHPCKNETASHCGGDHAGRIPGINFIKRQHNQPRPFGVANGISNRVDRVGCIGNAVAPEQVYPILKAIADIERTTLGATPNKW